MHYGKRDSEAAVNEPISYLFSPRMTPVQESVSEHLVITYSQKQQMTV